jgi:hypothetical protein
MLPARRLKLLHMWSKFDRWVIISFSEPYEMPRKKMVEGAVLDLTGVSGVPVDVTAIVAAEKAEKAAAIEREKAEARAKKKEEKALAKYNKWLKKKEKKARKKGIVLEEEVIEEFDIESYIDSITLHKCIDCDMMVLLNDRCSPCHKVYMDAKNKRIMEYVTSKGMNKCNFCGVPRIDDCCTGFHFDHINMFLKTGTVGLMIGNDTDNNKIMEEIDKCQLLCVSCHSLVTKIEVKNGFIQQKIKLNKGFGNIEELVADYDRVMGPVYEKIKEKFRGVGGAGGYK